MIRIGRRALLGVAIVSVGAGCAAQRPSTEAPAAGGPTVVVEQRRDYRGPSLLRPDLGPEWNWNGQALPTGDPFTSVVKIEKFAPAEVNANQSYDYTIRVTNIAATMNLEDVMVTDRLPESGYDFQSSTPAGQRVGGTVVWNLGRMGVDETRSIIVRGRATGLGSLMNCASIVYTPMVCVRTNVVSAGIALSKFAPAEVIQCDEIPIRFVVSNPGTGNAYNVKINDPLPDGWTVNGAKSVKFDAGTLKGGESREFTAIAHSSSTGKFSNSATATADGDLSADASATTIVRRPKLEITKTASSETQILGRDALFTITVSNKGDGAARDFVLTDELTGAERITSISDGGTAAGSTVTWNLGTLAAGTSRTVTVGAERLLAGQISDIATAKAYCAETVTATAKIVYIGVPAVLLEVVDDPDPVLVGGTTTYTISVTNQGTAPDSDIVINCVLEDTVEFVAAGGATRGVSAGGKVTFDALAHLGPKEVAKWTVTIRGVKVGDTRFTCTMNTHETGRAVEETEATRIYK